MPDDLAKLSNVVQNDTVKKTAYNTLKAKVDAIDTSGFVATRTKFEKDIKDLDSKLQHIADEV